MCGFEEIAELFLSSVLTAAAKLFVEDFFLKWLLRDTAIVSVTVMIGSCHFPLWDVLEIKGMSS